MKLFVRFGLFALAILAIGTWLAGSLGSANHPVTGASPYVSALSTVAVGNAEAKVNPGDTGTCPNHACFQGSFCSGFQSKNNSCIAHFGGCTTDPCE
jgi:hypothetical protein